MSPGKDRQDGVANNDARQEQMDYEPPTTLTLGLSTVTHRATGAHSASLTSSRKVTTPRSTTARSPIRTTPCSTLQALLR